MAMTYQQWLAANRLQPTAANALAWFKSGQAPIGTPVPATLQPYLGGAATLQADTPGVDWPLSVRGASPYELQHGYVTPGSNPEMFTPAVAATPPGKLPVPQNPYLPQLGEIMRQITNLGATYNPQRRAVAETTAANLAGSGLVDFGLTPGAPKVVQGPNGPQVTYDYTTQTGSQPSAFGGPADITYGVVQGADGRAYLQAYSGVAHAGASRGVFSGSQVDTQQQQARQPLDLQRQQAYQGMQSQQAGITGQEQSQIGSLQQSWADYMSKAAGEAANTVAGWSATPSTPAVAPTYTGPTQPQSGPSPLTQMTGGQRTVTGAAGPARTSTATTISTAAARLRKGATGLTTKSTQWI